MRQCVCVFVYVFPAHFSTKATAAAGVLNKRWQDHNIRRLPANKTMILSNLKSDISCFTSTLHVNCDTIMFATKWKQFSSAQRDSLTWSLPFFVLSLPNALPLSRSLPTHLLWLSCPPSVSHTHTQACRHRARRAYGYFSRLWRVALKLWHPYRLALRWARFARALRLSVALFQTERKKGGLTRPSLTHTLTVSYTLIHEARTHTNGDNEMSLHAESRYLRQAALQNWQVSGEC